MSSPMNNNNYTIFALLLISLFFSCNRDKANIQHFTCDEDTLFIEYKKDIINIRDNENGPVVDQWFLYNGEWYTCIDTTLCMSLKDTIIYKEEALGVKYVTEVKKINDNEYMCVYSDITLEECVGSGNALVNGRRTLSIINYDKNYHINSMVKRTQNEYILQNDE